MEANVLISTHDRTVPQERKEAMKPRAYTESELRKVGVEIVQFSTVRLRCCYCRTVWKVRTRASGHLPKDYWQCPNGCSR
jgi:hypothetical protein